MTEPRSFFLCLADRQSWRLVAHGAAAPWLERLAAIMGLSESGPENSSLLLFTFEKPTQLPRSLCTGPKGLKALTAALPGDGWRSRQVSRVSLLSHPDVPHVICSMAKPACEGEEILTLWAGLTPVYAGVQQAEGLLVHGGLFSYHGQGVLLVAPSGMGKSTCARRLGLPWRSLCDDQVLVVKVGSGLYRGHPLPTWSDLWGAGRRTWPVHEHVPIRAVFFLHRDTVNRIEPMGKGRAAALISKSVESMMSPTEQTLDGPEERRDFRIRLFDNASRFTASLPCFMLHADLTTRFWEQMEEGLLVCSGETCVASTDQKAV
jgi:SynChlorMet cassette protein ScmC